MTLDSLEYSQSSSISIHLKLLLFLKLRGLKSPLPSNTRARIKNKNCYVMVSRRFYNLPKTSGIFDLGRFRNYVSIKIRYEFLESSRTTQLYNFTRFRIYTLILKSYLYPRQIRNYFVMSFQRH